MRMMINYSYEFASLMLVVLALLGQKGESESTKKAKLFTLNIHSSYSD